MSSAIRSATPWTPDYEIGNRREPMRLIALRRGGAGRRVEREQEHDMAGNPRDLDTKMRLLSLRMNRRTLGQTAGGLAGAAGLTGLATRGIGAAGGGARPAAYVRPQDVTKGGTLVSMVVAEPTSMD